MVTRDTLLCFKENRVFVGLSYEKYAMSRYGILSTHCTHFNRLVKCKFFIARFIFTCYHIIQKEGGFGMKFFGDHQAREYDKSLSFTIIFQARYHDILDIASGMPTRFQSAMRDQGYPNFNVDIRGSNAMQDLIKRDLGEVTRLFNTFIFSSVDPNRPYTVSISKDSISLEHKGSYDEGMDFKNRLMRVLDSFVDIYKCSEFTRVGLRHCNIANKHTVGNSQLNLSDTQSFPSPLVFPELYNQGIDGSIYMDRLYILQENNIKVNALYSVGTVSGQYGLMHITNEPSYTIDIDCYCDVNIIERKDIDSYYEVFENIYKNAFEWSITDELRKYIQ